MKFYILRTIGNFCDTMSRLWEGDDLPTFCRDGNPYCFTDYVTVQRVVWRLQAKYPVTMDTPSIPSQPITYMIASLEIINSSAQSFAPEQHLACFL